MLKFSILLFFLSSQVFSKTHCYLVSGIEHDWSGAFDEVKKELSSKEILLKSGPKCRVFNSWKELLAQYNEDSKNFNPKKDQILLSQGAHGSKDGSVSCNSGYSSRDEIVNAMSEISLRFKTAMALESCYSAEIMKAKLLNDIMDPESPTVNNLCLITSSNFGRTTTSRKNDLLPSLFKAEKGANFEDVFKNSDLWSTEDGLISSVAWSEAGIDKFFYDKLDPANVLNVMSENSLQCEAATNPFPFLCSPDLDDELYFAINFVDSIDMDSCIDCFYTEEEFIQFKPDFDYLYHELLPEVDPTLARSCIDELYSKYSQYNKMHLNFGYSKLARLIGIKSLFENLPVHCVSVDKAKPGGALKIMSRMFSKENPEKLISDYQLFEYSLDLIKKKTDIDLTEIEHEKENFYYRELDRTFEMKKVLTTKVTNQIGEKYKNKSCDGQKDYILNTILGIDTPRTEWISVYAINYKFMAKLAMQTFVTGSLSKKKMENPMDKKRRRACRDFILK